MCWMPVYPLKNILAVLLIYKALEMIMGLNIYLLQKSWLQVCIITTLCLWPFSKSQICVKCWQLATFTCIVFFTYAVIRCQLLPFTSWPFKYCYFLMTPHDKMFIWAVSTFELLILKWHYFCHTALFSKLFSIFKLTNIDWFVWNHHVHAKYTDSSKFNAMLQHCHLYSLVHEHHVDTSLLKCLFLAHYAEFPISIHVNVQ